METQLRLTQESPRRRGRPSSVRLSEAARRTGREGVAMARRELDRVRNSTVTSGQHSPEVGRVGTPAAPEAASTRNAA
jgi:hypothetical protein